MGTYKDTLTQGENQLSGPTFEKLKVVIEKGEDVVTTRMGVPQLELKTECLPSLDAQKKHKKREKSYNLLPGEKSSSNHFPKRKRYALEETSSSPPLEHFFEIELRLADKFSQP
ncbi:hypothetical protein VNO80_15513 [Phaseolus coccineus]|uniref:Uncharacterized protein n=1 Tax=Phaseolus coccineus TaxID=3886 RepID=A0AAN9MKF6_PHACN